MKQNENQKIHLTIEEMLLFDHFINSIDAREFIAHPYCQVFLNIQSKIQAALPEQCDPSNKKYDDAFEEAKNNILPWMTFKNFFCHLLEDWENERENDKDLDSASDLTKTLWGGEDDQTPYVYLESDAPPIAIIDAIEGYTAEYQNAGAWEIMDAMVQKMTYFELQNLDIGDVIDQFDVAIHRPDLYWD